MPKVSFMRVAIIANTTMPDSTLHTSPEFCWAPVTERRQKNLERFVSRHNQPNKPRFCLAYIDETPLEIPQSQPTSFGLKLAHALAQQGLAVHDRSPNLERIQRDRASNAFLEQIKRLAYHSDAGLLAQLTPEPHFTAPRQTYSR